MESQNLVWTKISYVWWVGEKVYNPPKDLISGCEDTFVQVVKFFDPDEPLMVVKNPWHIVDYANDKENYIRIGLSLLKHSPTTLRCFKKDVLEAERRIGGELNILKRLEAESQESERRNVLTEGLGMRQAENTPAVAEKKTVTDAFLRKPEGSATPGPLDNKKFHCEQCGFGTDRMNVLNVHKQVHTDNHRVQTASKKKFSEPVEEIRYMPEAAGVDVGSDDEDKQDSVVGDLSEKQKTSEDSFDMVREPSTTSVTAGASSDSMLKWQPSAVEDHTTPPEDRPGGVIKEEQADYYEPLSAFAPTFLELQSSTQLSSNGEVELGAARVRTENVDIDVKPPIVYTVSGEGRIPSATTTTTNCSTSYSGDNGIRFREDKRQTTEDGSIIERTSDLPDASTMRTTAIPRRTTGGRMPRKTVPEKVYKYPVVKRGRSSSESEPKRLRTESPVPVVDETPKNSTETALIDEKIIGTMFGHLSSKDLLSCRLVSKEWKRMADLSLRSRVVFIHVNDRTDFDELINSVLDHGEEKFPFHGIEILCYRADFGWNPKKWEKLPFFRLYGHLFSALRLKLGLRPDSSIVKLLSVPFKHISSLELCRVDDFDKANDDSGVEMEEKTEFPQLTAIKLSPKFGDVNNKFLEFVLRSSPNLQRITGSHISVMPIIASGGKTSLVTDITVCGCNTEDHQADLSAVSSITLACAKLKGNSRARAPRCKKIDFKVVTSVLKSSSDAVQVLRINLELLPVKTAKWPVLKLGHLKTLEIRHPLGFPSEVGHLFPVLETVVLCPVVGKTYGEAELKKYFWENGLSTVSSLELRCHVDSNGMQYLAALFPYVKHVLVDLGSFPDNQTRDVAEDIWLVKYFKSLSKFDIVRLPVIEDVPPFCWRSSAPRDGRLDKLFTGLSQSIITKLRGFQLSEKEHERALVDRLRDGDSVASLKGLEELNVFFVRRKEYEFDSDFESDEDSDSESRAREQVPDDKEYLPVISDVAYQFGLKFVPELHTRFYYDFGSKTSRAIETALQPIAHLIPCYHRDESSF